MPEDESRFIPKQDTATTKRDNNDLRERPEEIRKEIIGNGFETIIDPEDERLKEVYDFYQRIFKQEEVEPFESFQAELRNEKAPALCNILRDPQSNEIVCVSWGNVMTMEGEDNKAVLVGKLTATDKRYRRMDLATAIVGKRNADAENLAKQKKEEYMGLCNEATNSSEEFWNQWSRRIYIQESDGSLREIFYQLPPFEWNSKTGEPLTTGVTEHFQIQSDSDTISPEKCLNYIRTIYKNWYIKPREEFENDQAFENHKKRVKEILGRIEAQFKSQEGDLVFLSKQEREKRIKNDEQIVSLKDEKAS